MADQANNLRTLMLLKEAEEKEQKPLSGRVITVTSGKGGVGKSNFTVNLAIQLSRQGKRVIVIDADFGLANIEVLMGLSPKGSMLDVIKGEKQMEEVLSETPFGIKYISGGSGLAQLADMDKRQIDFLIEGFARIDSMADIILIDTGAGISNQIINLISAAREAIIITTPEPTSITDAYAIIKTLKEKKGTDIPKINLVVNKAESFREGEEIFYKINSVSERFLSINLNCMGFLLWDEQLVKAVKAQTPVSVLYPDGTVSQTIIKISQKVLRDCGDDTNGPGTLSDTGFKGFIKRLANIFK